MVLVFCTWSDHACVCTNFHENISKSYRVTELTPGFLVSKFSKGHSSVNNVGRVMVLVLNTSPYYCLYLYKVS